MVCRTPQQPVLFLSDVHLGGFSRHQNRQLEQQLIRVVDYCQSKKIKICILGDLYDYWMEYPGHRPDIGERLNRRFKEYNDQFGPTLFITGNHDNWTRDYFTSIGFKIESSYRKLEYSGKQLLLLHGDGLLNSNGSLERPAMHRLLRNDKFIKIYQTLLPPEAGVWVMKWFSRINRLLGPLKEDTAVLNNWAEKLLAESDTDIIICGHDHFPRKNEFSFGTFLNLGTFYKHRTMALYNNGEVKLVVWNDDCGQLENHQIANTSHG